MRERILEFLKAENKSSAMLAEEIGVQPSGISHILSGRNRPSLDFVLKMLEKYKSLSTEWLLFGRGSMYGDVNMQTLFDQDAGPWKPEHATFSGDDSRRSEADTDPGIKGKKNRDTAVIISGNGPSVVKIVWFYDDRSFREYSPA
jgi:transcriptional regulator with XRE-family HTH domain